MKKILAVLMIVCMLASSFAFADDAVRDKIPADQQIDFIFKNLNALSCDKDDVKYSYAITDLDRNGRLELFAAVISGTDYKTSGKIFEINEKFDGFDECVFFQDTDKYVPDVIAASANAFTAKDGTVYYIVPDVYVNGPYETSETLGSFSYKNGKLESAVLGSKKSSEAGPITIIECYNASGLEITPFDYADIAANKYADCVQSTVFFDWFALADAQTADRLKDSYNVFKGEKTLTAAPQIQPQITAVPEIVYATSNPNLLYITKNPTSETVNEGGNAVFIARAENYNYITWRLVSPNGYTVYSMNDAVWQFRGLSVNGDGTCQLILSNCPVSLSGWGVEAVFTGYSGQAVTNRAYVTVKKAAKAQLYASPSSGYFEYCDQAIQLISNPGDTIHYEMSRSGGISMGSGEVKSGGYCYIGAIADLRYDVYLYAYVVGDPSNAISCSYVMDCLPYYNYDDYDVIDDFSVIGDTPSASVNFPAYNTPQEELAVEVRDDYTGYDEYDSLGVEVRDDYGYMP